MSIWTHVNGCLRVDTLGDNDADDKDEIKKVLGITCSSKSSKRSWRRCNVPKGSEGSIQYKLIKHRDGLWTIPIWGDLRDFGADVKTSGIILKWFDKICNSRLDIRSFILELHTEHLLPIVYRYSESDYPNKKKRWKNIEKINHYESSKIEKIKESSEDRDHKILLDARRAVASIFTKTIKDAKNRNKYWK